MRTGGCDRNRTAKTISSPRPLLAAAAAAAAAVASAWLKQLAGWGATGPVVSELAVAAAVELEDTEVA